MRANTDLIRHWFEEVWNRGRAEAIDELLAPGAVIHGLMRGNLVGLEAFRAFHSLFQAAFYDIDVAVEKTIEDEDSVTAWCRATAIHRETGKRVSFSGAIFGRFVDGKLQEGWNCWDFLGLLIQLGAVDAANVEALLGTRTPG